MRPTPAERVRAMADEGRIDEAEAQRLLAALDAKPGPSRARVLVDPFERLDIVQSVAVGFAVALGAIAVTRLGARFDGFLDAHTAKVAPPLAVAALEQLVAWPGGALVLWLVSLAFDRRVRFVDFLGALGIARAPVVAVMAPVALIVPYADRPAALGAIIAAAIACLGWSGTLLYFGFKHASGLRGPRFAAALVIGIAAAEVLSKLALQAVS